LFRERAKLTSAFVDGMKCERKKRRNEDAVYNSCHTGRVMVARAGQLGDDWRVHPYSSRHCYRPGSGSNHQWAKGYLGHQKTVRRNEEFHNEDDFGKQR
jgi:hypothetical protein